VVVIREAEVGVIERRFPRSLRESARELRVSWREADSAVLGPRIAAFVYFAAGVLTLIVCRVAAVIDSSMPLTAIGLSATIFGAVAIVLPWHRWPARAQLAFALFAFVLFAWGGVLAANPIGPYLAALPLPFVFVGFTQPPGTSLLLSPIAGVALVVAARGTVDQTLVATLLFALPISVLVGEMIAQAELHRQRAEHRVDRLLHAVRVLARVADERAGANLVAALAAELLSAQAVAVLLADRPSGRRYLNRAFFGHPALSDAAPLIVDSYGELALDSGATRFVSMRRTRRAVRAAAIVPLPGSGDAPIGLVIAMWSTPRRRLHAGARDAAELLSEEAGRMFRRLRESAALVHDAETDPLTELANRRTFARALNTLQPEDALVIVDLDHFKAVNDEFGHQVGDQTLRALARCLRETTRQVDCVARYGGEEFAVVLPGAGASGARSMLARMRHAWSASEPTTTFSAGVAIHAEGELPRDTLGRADSALYEAKQSGRNCDMLARTAEVVLP
jgi:diguanylate cyclase (GGDEF)-like protein